MYYTTVSNDVVIGSTTLNMKECIKFSKRGYDDYVMGKRQQYRPVYALYQKFGKSKVKIRFVKYIVAGTEYELKKALKEAKQNLNDFI
tara:strand:- start:4034 stop:4297 length:264 start_codon:yes stop_codon:yes gene_type:complete